MTGLVLLIVTLVHHVVSIAIHARLVVTVMIALVRLIVTLVLLVALIAIHARLVVTVMTGRAVSTATRVHLVHLIVTLVHHAASIVVRVRLVVTVMIVLAGLTVIHVRHVLQLRNVPMKLKAALANVAQVAKCLCHPSVLVKIG
jgi:hypothetical protein